MQTLAAIQFTPPDAAKLDGFVASASARCEVGMRRVANWLVDDMARLYRVSFLAGRPASRGLVVRLPMSNAEACLTRTLIGIIAMSLVLVTPSELVNLNFYSASPTDGQRLGAAIVVTNALQTANFSFNFVLSIELRFHMTRILARNASRGI